MRILTVLTMFVLVAFTMFLSAQDKKQKATLHQGEAKKAFEYLNRVRVNPGSFSKEIGVNLKGVEKRDALKWNDILVKVAEEKALSMAKHNYAGHVTPDGFGINHLIHNAGYKLPEEWLQDKKVNYFEQFAASTNMDGVGAIRLLIVDKGHEDLGHRKSLLGMDNFRKGFVDVGIGIAHNPQSTYKWYACIIVARQK